MRKSFLLMIVLSLLFVCPSDLHAKKEKVVRSTGGVAVPPYGLSIDASYDPRLDTLVPGYKVINVVLMNTSFNIIPLDPRKDRWTITMAGSKKSVPALHNLRSQAPGVWSQLPEKVQDLIGYPLVLPIGGREVIDIFVSDKYDVSQFNELQASLKSLGARFEILVTK